MRWTDALPRPYYRQYEKVDLKDEWFEVFRLPQDVYVIAEPRHFQEVNSFLIIGAKYSVLLDTGMGIGNIRKVVDQLIPPGTGGVKVVNSHFHFDHVADDYRFNEVYLFKEAHAFERLSQGCSSAEMAHNVQPAMFWGKPPAGFDPAAYVIPPVKPLLVEDGHRFDLGNRKLQVVHTPGHTWDCLMLLDVDNRILFTGDSFYKGALYLHFQSPAYGYSDIAQYTVSMKKAAAMADTLQYLYCSHNDPVADPALLHRVVAALEQMKQADTEQAAAEVGLHDYEEEGEKLTRIVFDEFSIILQRQ